MDDKNSREEKKQNSKQIKNTILIISIVYFLFVLEESQDAIRIRFYKLLIFISALFLLLTNFEFCKNYLKDSLIIPLYKKFADIKDENDKSLSRKILDMTLKKNFVFNNNENLAKEIITNEVDANNSYNYTETYLKNNFINLNKSEFHQNAYNTSNKPIDFQARKYTEFNKPHENVFSYDPKAFNPNYNYTPIVSYDGSYGSYANHNINTAKKLGNENIFTSKRNLSNLQEDNSEGGVTYRYYQELKDSKKFKGKLEQFDILSYFTEYSKIENSQQFVFEGENYNINRLIENTKKFFSEENIPYILNYHFENFDNINKIFIETLKVELVSKMQDEIDLSFFKEEMSKLIHDSYLNFPNDGLYSSFGKLQNFYDSNERNYSGINRQFDTTVNQQQFLLNKNFNFAQQSSIPDMSRNDRNFDKKKIKFSIYFGDNRKIKLLIDIIDSKLFMLMKNKFNQASTVNTRKSGFEKENIYGGIQNDFGFSGENPLELNSQFESELNKLRIQNPLIRKNKYNLVLDYSEAIAKNNNYLENNLKLLRFLLETRLELNNFLTCPFIKIKDINHYYINLEYSVKRLMDLQKDKLNSYRNDTGGKFFEDNWISAFPTDSQLLFSLFLKFLEKLWNDHNQGGRPFLIAFPLSPILEDNPNNIFFYQNNDSSVEPHLNLIYRKEIIFIKSGRDNLFEAIVNFLLVLKLKMDKLEKKLNIEDFTNYILKC